MADSSTPNPSAPIVAIVAWLLPGAGYWLIGQKARALLTGISILFLFTAGLLIGGVRLIEVPGYGDHGEQLIVSRTTQKNSDQNITIEQVTEPRLMPMGATPAGWVIQVHPLDEIRNKPWYIAQILNGPLNMIASWGSVKASQVGPTGETAGYRSHARTNELGVLYTAVAGMLNLLVIIDSASRAGKSEESA